MIIRNYRRKSVSQQFYQKSVEQTLISSNKIPKIKSFIFSDINSMKR